MKFLVFNPYWYLHYTVWLATILWWQYIVVILCKMELKLMLIYVLNFHLFLISPWSWGDQLQAGDHLSTIMWGICLAGSFCRVFSRADLNALTNGTKTTWAGSHYSTGWRHADWRTIGSGYDWCMACFLEEFCLVQLGPWFRITNKKIDTGDMSSNCPRIW